MLSSPATRPFRLITLLAGVTLLAACTPQPDHGGDVSLFARDFCEQLAVGTSELPGEDAITGADIAALYTGVADAADAAVLPAGGAALLAATRTTAEAADTIDGLVADADETAVEHLSAALDTMLSSVESDSELGQALRASDGCQDLPWGDGLEQLALDRALDTFLQALRQAAFDAQDPDPEGGDILRITPRHVDMAAATLDGEAEVFIDVGSFEQPGRPRVEIDTGSLQACILLPDSSADQSGSERGDGERDDLPEIEQQACER